MVVRIPYGGGIHGGLFHSQNVEAIFFHTPGLKVVAPATPYDAKGLLKSSIRDNNPVIFMESEQMYGDKAYIPEEEYLIPLGQANIIKKGSAVTIVSYGKMMNIALNASSDLNEENIFPELIDLRTLRPIDYDLIINSVKKTNRLIIVEESWPLGSISSEISYKIQKEAFDYLDAPISRICSADTPMAYSATLVEEFLPNKRDIIDKVKEVMYL